MPKLPPMLRKKPPARPKRPAESGARTGSVGKARGGGLRAAGRFGSSDWGSGIFSAEVLRLNRKPSVRAVVEFTRSFAVMVSARLPLVEALETATMQSEDERLQGVLAEVARRVRGGRSLSESLARHPEVFGRLYVQLVRVGEVAGVLDTVLLRLATYLEKGQALKRRIRLALAYPAVVLVVATGATAFLLTVIVPTFAEMFADFGAELPVPTRVIIAVSDAVRESGLLLLGVLAGLAWGVRYALQTERGRLVWDRLRMRAPVYGTLYRRALTARFCRTLGTMVESGVALTDALDVTAGTMDNGAVEDMVREMQRRVTRGSSLAVPLGKAAVFPPMVVQMVTVGEETARLGEMLGHVAEHYEGEVDSAVEALASVIEPIMIVLLGIVLGALLVAIYLPMFELTSAIQ